MCASWFAFFFFLFCASVCVSVVPFRYDFCREDAAKAMALQRNVVYTVTRRMDEWVKW